MFLNYGQALVFCKLNRERQVFAFHVFEHRRGYMSVPLFSFVVRQPDFHSVALDFLDTVQNQPFAVSARTEEKFRFHDRKIEKLKDSTPQNPDVPADQRTAALPKLRSTLCRQMYLRYSADL